MSVHAAILAGGRGERFWPLSRAARPKQVLRLIGQRSLLAETVARAHAGVRPDQLWVISAQDQRSALESLSLPVPPDRFVWEPIGRNTAPAIGAAAALVQAFTAQDRDALLLVLPSDHWIPDPAAFWRSVERGKQAALAHDLIVTFGIPVTRPETGYGYIERGSPLAASAFTVSRFHEKPSLSVAQEYQAAGRFYWNAGIFLVRARTILEELKRYLPQMSEPLAGLEAMLARDAQLESSGGVESPGRIEPSDRTHPMEARGAHGLSDGWRSYFQACPAISLDHGVLERSERVGVVEAEFSWSDLGGWEAWADLQQPDAQGNRGAGDLLLHDARDNIIFTETGHLVALLGVSDLVVVQTEDATLVCPRDRAQEIRELVRRGRADPRWKERF
jgi:mannose-1-phosphate guanylyltransferase